MLLGERDRSVARKARVLDRVDTGEDRVVDSLVAVGVRRDLQPKHMRLVRDRLHCFEAELLGAGAVAERKHAAGLRRS